MIDEILVMVGGAMVVVGVACDLIAAIGMLRLPNFFVRLHAATVGTIGGSFLPILGTGIMVLGTDFLAYKWLFFGGLVTTAILVLLVAPAGSHALARAAHRSKAAKVEPKLVDHLEEDGVGR
jgi:multicomponent Na+:H+ antiporter subunit G